MGTPLVSVIVPVYKTPEQFLRACIESIQQQTIKDLQIILVDDGSPDKCGDICDQYAEKDKRIQVIHQKMADRVMLEIMALSVFAESILSL